MVELDERLSRRRVTGGSGPPLPSGHRGSWNSCQVRRGCRGAATRAWRSWTKSTSWTPDAWDALALAGGTRPRPLVLGISTECDDDPDGLMVRLVDHGRAGGDPDFYFREFTAPAGVS